MTLASLLGAADPGALGYALAAPGWGWLAVAVLAVAGLRRRQRPLVDLAGPQPGAALPTTWRARCAGLPEGLGTAALLLFVLALARPIERRPAPPAPPGRELMVVLDTSSSMAATDLAPDRTRLAVGRQVAAEFVLGRPHDRVGVVAFARYADLRCPLTGDHEALRTILGGLELVTREGPEDATAIGAAVGTAALALQRAGGGAPRPRAIVLVTDGEENVAGPLAPDEIAPLHAAQLCRQAGIRVHGIVVGKGKPGADGAFVALDTAAVRQLASTTGGRFFTAGDAQALAAVWAAIDSLEAVAVPVPVVEEHDLDAHAIALALVCLVLATLLAATWLRGVP
ncbi:MAG: VWA domain-containing protein [Planctomycetota bacterium]